jgi:undecaprenyl-diphosphatase
MRKKLYRNIGSISLKTFLLFLLFLVSLTIFVVIAHEIIGEKDEGFDDKVFAFFSTWATPVIIKISHALTFFGNTYFLICAYFIVALWLYILRRKEDAMEVAIIAISSSLLLFALKSYFSRHRPLNPLFQRLTNFSFPSGHALSSFVFCMVLIYLVHEGSWKKGWKWIVYVLLILFSLLIGISRIILRYHYPSDVLAGYGIAAAWIILFYWWHKMCDIKNYEKDKK